MIFARPAIGYFPFPNALAPYFKGMLRLFIHKRNRSPGWWPLMPPGWTSRQRSRTPYLHAQVEVPARPAWDRSPSSHQKAGTGTVPQACRRGVSMTMPMLPLAVSMSTKNKG